ncbi:MmcQ/YjbR family DNA-binding protein [Pantoea sp. 1.19]|uniref:MmcQ/YjbR family DNA-binding protein n=1 Tax=Pantoea sp. 1.19 TaxID=1925589 RepID=UPI000948F6BE|nr:MmcQ/YjbR family DNA-binding protein [Pantoea sp. 1.19]
MTTSDFLAYCMAKEGAEQSVHGDWKATQIKTHGVLFALVHDVKPGGQAVSLKTSEALARDLRDKHKTIVPSEHLNPVHWSTLWLEGSLKDSEIYWLVDASYQLARG